MPKRMAFRILQMKTNDWKMDSSIIYIYPPLSGTPLDYGANRKRKASNDGLQSAKRAKLDISVDWIPLPSPIPRSSPPTPTPRSPPPPPNPTNHPPPPTTTNPVPLLTPLIPPLPPTLQFFLHHWLLQSLPDQRFQRLNNGDSTSITYQESHR